MEFDSLIFLDGATGTVLQQNGMKPGAKPEFLNIEDPDLIIRVHEGYIQAGSQIVCSNTFGANPLKLKDSPYALEEIIAAAIANARKAGGSQTKVALDIGPLGELMEPMGALSFEQAYDAFKRIVIAGEKAGADLVFFETMSDLLEVKAGVLAAKEHTHLPIFASMSFEASGRTFTGCTVESMGMTLTGLGVDALGMNCSVGPDLLAGLIERLAAVTDLPIIAKPNAGLPDPIDGHYDMDPDRFLEAMKLCVAAGASVIGGCCGTTPAYISGLTDSFAEILPARRKKLDHSMVCTPLLPVIVDRVTPIGERINPTGKKRMQQALLNKDLDYLVRLALEQQEAGARILDVNVGYPGVDEPTMLPLVVQTLQRVCDLPLQLDSSDPTALERALRIYNGKPAVNSINAKQEVMDTLLPLVKKYGAAVVALTLDEEGIPPTAQKRVELARTMKKEAERYGIPARDIWIDPLCLTVSAQQDQARETLNALEQITRELHLNTVLGVSNISFGLPARPLITQTFLVEAMALGLRLPIVNPNQQEIMDAIAAFEVLENLDPGCAAYIDRFTQRTSSASVPVFQKPAPVSSAPSAKECACCSPAGFPAHSSLQQAVIKGLQQEAVHLAKERLGANAVQPLDLVEQELIPALDQVGMEYEAGRMFLPQLLSAANAAQGVFEVLRDVMARSGEETLSKGTIVLATVQGDVHDIGKNIVKTVLENYGFTILDLGKDTAPETVVQAVLDHDVALVGLSALMTTTLPAMEKTVRMLKESGHPVKIMVGGAVVTPAYAASIGADFYAKDANASAAYAKEVFGV